jgi:MFS family permease
MSDAERAGLPAGAALYLGLVQFLFVTTWTVYVAFLPQLLASAGLPPRIAPWVLLVDQLVFMVMDVYTGIAADRVQRTLGRLGPMIVGWTVVSCLAFLLLPHAVLLGTAAPAAALLLTLVWTTTSSALRAPPWVLLGKHAAKPALPWASALMLVGLAAGGALSHYLGIALKNVDPRLPFALSSLTLLAATAGIVHVERRLGRARTAAAAPPEVPHVLTARHAAYLSGILLLALGFQVHSSLNSTAQYLRLATRADLEWLLPLFWIGFGVAMMPGSALARRWGALPVMAVAAAIGTLATAAAARAPSLDALIAAQLVAGGAWGSMLMAAFASAPAFGRSGREGFALGSMFAMLALATLARIAAVLAGVPADPARAAVLAWLPPLCWAGGAVLIAALAARPQPARP